MFGSLAVRDSKAASLTPILTANSSAPQPLNEFDPVFLGLIQDRPVFAADLENVTDGQEEAGSSMANSIAATAGGEWTDIRSIGSQMSRHDAALLAYARGMIEWQRR